MNSFPVNFYIRHAWVRARAFVWKGAGIFFCKDRHKLFIEGVGFAGAVAPDEAILLFQRGNSSYFLARTLHIGPELLPVILKAVTDDILPDD